MRHNIDYPSHEFASGNICADIYLSSFEMPAQNSADNTTSPLRRRSSEAINIIFSPSGSPPRFASQNLFSPRRPPEQDGARKAVQTDDQETSPTDTRSTGDPAIGSDIPPPPKVGDKWSSEDWERRFGVHTFEIPEKDKSSRGTSRKRSGTPKTSVLNGLRRSAFSRNAFQPTVADDGDEPSTTEASQGGDIDRNLNHSTMSNRSDGSAMDIDTPPPGSSGARPTKADQPSPLPTQSRPTA